VPLALRDVTFGYEGHIVLDHVSLEVRSGEIVALIGPSGAGKTTVFQIALGFRRPWSGEVWVGGREISHLSERELSEIRRDEGIVFQDAALFTSMDVEENVGFGLSESGLPEEEIAKRVHRTLASVGLENFEDRMPDELSGGQAQRVAVARAIITEPRVMFYDEPTTGLDPRRGLDVVDQVVRLTATGVASLVVTHQIEYWRNHCHRTVLLEDGRIQYDGPPRGLRALHDPFVGSFFELLDVPPDEQSPDVCREAGGG
jgi:phospholipid/cholesterol/gamma-HCH transport system ATP-binding protein